MYFLNKHPKILMSINIFAALLIGVIRYLTGHEYALSLFYLFPIFAITWFLGFKKGIAIVIICTLSWLSADLLLVDKFSKPWIPFINETLRCLVFVSVAYITAKLRMALEIQKKLAMTDDLTQIYNRHAFFQKAKHEIKRAQRLQTTLSLAYIDLDNFKNLNDTLGHDVGDKLLRKLAEKTKIHIREIDILARIGGDEFALLFPGTNEKEAAIVIQRIKDVCVDNFKQNNWDVTLSIGVVTFHLLPENVSEMLKIADTIMYSAKKQNKNSINSLIWSTHRVTGDLGV